MADDVRVRTAIGAVLIAAIVGLLVLDHATGRGLGVVCLCVCLNAAGLLEFARMAGPTAPIAAGPLVFAGAAYTAAKGLGLERFAMGLGGEWGWWLHLPVALAWAYGVGFACLRGAPSPERFRGLAAGVLGFCYIPFLGGFALDVRFSSPDYGAAAFFYVVAIAKGTDICAYFAGKSLGRVKLVPSVSPGKTRAGFVGAVVGAVGITAAFAHFSALGQVLPWPLVPGAGIVMALVVISGDLIESFIKRSVEVKDSAKLLPGFGGVLDIVDSVIIAAPVVYGGLWALERLRSSGALPLG